MFEDKKVLFITTKNLDYLRNTQEIDLIKKETEQITVIGSLEKSYVKRLLKIYWKLLTMSVKEYDSIFIGFSPQLILPLFGWKFRKKKIIIDFFISVYDTMIFDRKKFKEKSFMAKICKWVDEKTIRRAEYVISDTNAHGDYFSEEFQIERKKIHTLYLKADESIYYKRVQKKPEAVKDKFVVLYFGSVLPLQGTDIIAGAMKLLKDKNDIYFYFIGPVKEEEKIMSENIEYISWLSQEQLAEYIGYSDLCLAGHFNKNINKAKRTIPGKAYIYRAMEKAMILGDNPATHELYEEGTEGIYFVEMGSIKKLAEKIVECKESITKMEN